MLDSVIKLFAELADTAQLNFVKAFIIVFPLFFALLSLQMTGFNDLDILSRCMFTAALDIIHLASFSFFLTYLLDGYKEKMNTILFANIVSGIMFIPFIQLFGLSSFFPTTCFVVGIDLIYGGLMYLALHRHAIFARIRQKKERKNRAGIASHT